MIVKPRKHVTNFGNIVKQSRLFYDDAENSSFLASGASAKKEGASPYFSQSRIFAQAVRRSAAVTQLDINIAIVIGPTPPGTGVMAAQRSATAS